MDLSENTDLRWLSGLIGDMRSIARGRDLLMVGAMARDLLLQYGGGVQIRRATTDVDLAFAVASWDEFGAFRNALLSSGLFNESRHEHKLLHKGTLEIDLIPYGGVEDAAGQIHWPASENLMSVLGYQEARATAVEIVLPDDQRISTVSLPMLAVMKIVAWSDQQMQGAFGSSPGSRAGCGLVPGICPESDQAKHRVGYPDNQRQLFKHDGDAYDTEKQNSDRYGWGTTPVGRLRFGLSPGQYSAGCAWPPLLVAGHREGHDIID